MKIIIINNKIQEDFASGFVVFRVTIYDNESFKLTGTGSGLLPLPYMGQEKFMVTDKVEFDKLIDDKKYTNPLINFVDTPIQIAYVTNCLSSYGIKKYFMVWARVLNQNIWFPWFYVKTFED